MPIISSKMVGVHLLLSIVCKIFYICTDAYLQIRETWYQVFRTHFFKKALATAQQCKKGFYYYQKGFQDSEVSIQFYIFIKVYIYDFHRIFTCLSIMEIMFLPFYIYFFFLFKGFEKTSFLQQMLFNIFLESWRFMLNYNRTINIKFLKSEDLDL